MARATSAAVATALDEVSILLQQNGPLGPDGVAAFSGSGTFGTAVVSIQSRLYSGAPWTKVGGFNRTTNAPFAGNVALTDNTAFDLFITNLALSSDVKLVLESIGSGSVTIFGESGPVDLAPPTFVFPPIAIATVASVLTVSSANAFTVGPNGATNPTLNVVTNVASAATGINVTGRAAAAGVDILVISSGTNEDIRINAKGSGVLGLQGTATGNVTSGTGIIAIGATQGVGYGTGSGGTVTQITSITTSVTLNKVNGTITTVSSTLATGAIASFTLTNSTIAATDIVVPSIKSYGGTAGGVPVVAVAATAAGSCILTIRNNGATTLDAVIVISFAVIKGVAA